MCVLSDVRLFVTPWTVAGQWGALSMGFSRQYWRGLPFPSPEDLPDPGIEPMSPALQADSLLNELQRKLIGTLTSIGTLLNQALFQSTLITTEYKLST